MEKKTSPATLPIDESPTFDALEFVLFALGRFRYYIIAFAVIGLLFGVKNALKLPNLYSSEGEFLVRSGARERRTPETTLEKDDRSVPAPGLVEEIHLLDTPPLYLRLAEEIGPERLLEPYDPKFRDTENTRPWVKWVHEMQARFFFKGRPEPTEESEDELASEEPSETAEAATEPEEVTTGEAGATGETEVATGEEGATGETEEERNRRLGREVTPLKAAAKLAAGRTSFDPKKMGRRGDQGSRVVVIRYEAYSPELAQDVVSKLMELCRERHREIFAAPYQGEFLSKQLAKAESEEEAAREAYFEHVATCGFFEVDTQKRTLLQDIDRGDKSIYVSTTQRNVVRDELDQIRAEIVGLEPTEIISSTRPNPWISTLYASLLNVRMQIQNIKFAEGSPFYIEERDKLEETKSFIEQDLADQMAAIKLGGGTQDPILQSRINRRYELLVTREADLEARLRRLNIEIERDTLITAAKQQELTRLLACEPIHEDLTRETQKTQRRADLLAQKRDDAEVLDLMDQDDQMSNLVYVQEASYKPGKLGPTRKSKLIMGLLGGFGFGVVFAFLRQLLDSKLRFPNNIERTLGLRVLGVIPEQARWRRLGRRIRKAS